MAVTISNHNGSKVRQAHNRRDPKVTAKEPHIRAQGEFEIWKDEPEREAYHRLFDPALKRYNDKQVREDRKIDSYWNKVNSDKKQHTSYEVIIGVYGDDCDDTTKKAILKEFADGWQKRNPTLELIGAYFHNDEDGKRGPHAHLDYIPVAHGYTRGMDTQAGLVKALGEMGFVKDGNRTAQIQWEASENSVLTKICEEHGLVVDHPREQGRKHLETELFKKQKQVDDITAKLEKVTAERDAATRQLAAVLEKKSRASEIHHIFGDREIQEYHRNMLSETRSIGAEVYRELDELHHKEAMIDIKENEVKKKEDRILPLYKEAEETQQAALDLLAEIRKKEKDQDTLVKDLAAQLSAEQMQELYVKFHLTGDDRSERLEALCDRIELQNGESLLDYFNRMEEVQEHAIFQELEH